MWSKTSTFVNKENIIEILKKIYHILYTMYPYTENIQTFLFDQKDVDNDNFP